MSMRELTAAGITDPVLQRSYLRCRALNAQHGKTYFLATRLLPAGKRPFVHALYGLARYADEIVDEIDASFTPAQRADALDRWSDAFMEDLTRGHSDDPVAAAAVDTAKRWSIPADHFEAFFHSMRMDLTVETYDTYEALSEYVYGSAAVIGLQMVPVLEPRSKRAYDHARDLGIAFQLANFIRDVGEDLQRGRIYLPLDELAAHGVTPADVRAQRVTDNWREALAEQIGRVKMLQARANPGIAMLAPSSQPCIQAASTLYCGIVDEVAANDYDVFSKRASVSIPRRIAVAGPAAVRAVRARG
ncbi:MAG: phytoene/squalene synthase family protein [Candidatus Nanopelagicales bacterium]|jgi:phytoene synthase|nr:phytoene/squalene synthase family protein [Candidatus Nanopelagicales bacterium]MCU0295148.1 phytoene/squalene synthase family protein [Candidatus Nanopelagicales bacterium]